MELNNNKTEKHVSPEQQFQKIYDQMKDHFYDDEMQGRYCYEGKIDLSLITNENCTYLNETIPFAFAQKFASKYRIHAKNRTRQVGDGLLSIDLTKRCMPEDMLFVESNQFPFESGILQDVLLLIRQGYDVRLSYTKEENISINEKNNNNDEELLKFNNILNWDLDDYQYNLLKDYYLIMGLDFPKDAINNANSGRLIIKNGGIHYYYIGEEKYYDGEEIFVIDLDLDD